MGTYLFSKDINSKLFERLGKSDFEDLTIGIKKYLDPQGKTIDEVLEQLYEIAESKEDEVGAVHRFIKYTRGQRKLPESLENNLVDSEYLSYVVYQVERLKKWCDENAESAID